MADMRVAIPDIVTSDRVDILRIGSADYFDDELFRPSLADELKVGYFSLDRACQTIQSDVVDLKDMTVVLKTMLLDVSNMKRDIHLAKEKLKTDYDTKIQYKALDLCKRISDQMAEMEHLHKERVMVVRRAFRQQFADALARIGNLFKARFEQSVEKEKLHLRQEIQRLQGQAQQMSLTIQKNESIIIMLKNQLATKPAPSEEKEPSIDPAKLTHLTKEVEHLKEVVQVKEKAIGAMEDELEERLKEYNELGDKYSKLQSDFEKQEISRHQLSQELLESREEASQQAAAAKKMASMADELEQQRQEMERVAEERVKRARDEASGAGTERLREVQAEFAAKIRQLLKDNEDLEKQLLRERAKNLATPPKKTDDDLTDTEKLKKSEAMWRQLVDKYKKEIDRNNAAWEKKFVIMQASLHALKDESYLRHTLEKQHTALHHATISYTADGPRTVGGGAAASQRHSILPGIGNRAVSPDPLASFVVSVAPSRLSQPADNHAMSERGEITTTPRAHHAVASASSIRLTDQYEREKSTSKGSSRAKSSSVVTLVVPMTVSSH